MLKSVHNKLKSAEAILGSPGPTVDASNMIFFGSIGGYGPKIEFDFTSSRIVKTEPKVDLTSASLRWTLIPGGLGKLRLKHYFFSLVLHLAIFISVFSAYLLFSESTLLQEDEVPVQISFGFDVPGDAASSLPGKVGESERDQAATKTEQLLPQLPKQLTIEAAIPKTESLPLPSEEPSVEPDKQEKVEEKIANNEVIEKNDSKLQVKETAKPNTKSITPQELAKRLERESRKIDKTEKSGTHAEAGEGRKLRPGDLPSSPFSNDARDIPPAPSVLARGSLDGSISASARNQYGAAAKNHIQKFWSLPELAKFDSELRVRIDVTVNLFGRIIGTPRISKSSGVREFDEAALHAVRDAAPYPELPAELAPRQSLSMNFSPTKVEN